MLIASRSVGKMRELLPLLGDVGVRAASLLDIGLVETDEERALESFDTFEENALAKARYVARLFPGQVVFADDSGLEVLALDRRPGVRSKRWAGVSEVDGAALLDAANNAHLLVELAQAERAGRTDRSARYVCAAACVWRDQSFTARGVTEGRIIDAPSGDLGFGYDPYFYSTELGDTFGRVESGQKSSVSHRGRAFRALMALLRGHEAIAANLFGPVDPR